MVAIGDGYSRFTVGSGMEARLTKRVVDGLRPDGAEVRIWDTDVRGFGVRCRASGEKYYFLKYRVGGRQRWATIGRHGAPWTVEEARKEARRLLGHVVSGGDPMADKIESRRDITLAELCDLYFSRPVIITNRGTQKKPSSLAIDKSNAERHIKPLLGRLHVRAVAKSDIERFQQDVAAGKTAVDQKTKQRGRAIVKGGHGTAARSTAVLGALLSFAVSQGLRADNPAAGVKLLRPRSRERFLSAEEFKRLGAVLAKVEADGFNPLFVAAIRLLTLTGCRKSEILTLRWGWVDVERSVLRLPDSKSGAKVVPLGQDAVRLLATLPRVAENPFVLPGSKPGTHLTGLQKAWELVRRHAGLPDVRLHDLRHSFASVAVEGGESLYIVGKMLGHKQARTTEIYAHLGNTPLQQAAHRAGRRIARAMAAGDAWEPVLPEAKDDPGHDGSAHRFRIGRKHKLLIDGLPMQSRPMPNER